jgi:hypothetical protein
MPAIRREQESRSRLSHRRYIALHRASRAVVLISQLALHVVEGIPADELEGIIARHPGLGIDALRSMSSVPRRKSEI